MMSVCMFYDVCTVFYVHLSVLYICMFYDICLFVVAGDSQGSLPTPKLQC